MMDNQYNYSIIIPHYNIPDLLSRCLRSIPQRDDIQVIVVDDCSPDAESYPDRIPELSRSNVELYSTPMGGSAGRARNVGLEHARGRWLTFVDADDLLVENAFDLLDPLLDRPEDIIYFRSKAVMSDDLDKPSDRNQFVYHFNHYFSTADDRTLRYEFDPLWGKLIKRSFVENFNIRFDEVRYSNDTFFSAAIGVYADKIFVSRDVLYIVTERSGSLTSNKMPTNEEWNIRYHAALRVQELFDKNHISYKRYAFIDVLNRMKDRDKAAFNQALRELSLRNKLRYLYCRLREHK